VPTAAASCRWLAACQEQVIPAVMSNPGLWAAGPRLIVSSHSSSSAHVLFHRVSRAEDLSQDGEHGRLLTRWMAGSGA
jgi:hypothetical protein